MHASDGTVVSCRQGRRRDAPDLLPRQHHSILFVGSSLGSCVQLCLPSRVSLGRSLNSPVPRLPPHKESWCPLQQSVTPREFISVSGM